MNTKISERTHRIKALAADLGTLTLDAEGVLAQRDQALAALAAVVAAIQAGEDHPDFYGLPVLTRYGLAPAGSSPEQVLAAHAAARDAMAEPGTRLRRTARLPVSTHAPGCGRWLIAAVGAEWRLGRDVLDDACLVLSELVTNAVRHAAWHLAPVDAREIKVTVSLAAGTLRIEVSDPDPTMPRIGAEAEIGQITDLDSQAGLGGYGLPGIVGGLSLRYGARPDDAGKTVWADLDARPIGTGR
jgi:anti-sigma regulatory factor (Ser/Thr protein kinase)